MNPVWLRQRFQIRNRLLLNTISEFFGTILLSLLTTATVIQTVVSGGQLGGFFQLSFSVGVSVALIVYSLFYTSGAHINPAFSLTFYVLGSLRFEHFLIYFVAQFFGSFFGAVLVYHLYSDQLQHFAGGEKSIVGPKAIAPMFTSFPPDYVSNYTAFIDAVLSSAMLGLFVIAMIEQRNKIPSYMFPFLLGLLIFMLVSSFALNSGLTINPTANLAPRVFLFVAGYGWQVFSWHGYYFWIPVMGPLIGAPLGAFLYHIVVGIHIPDADSMETSTPKISVIRPISIKNESSVPAQRMYP